MLRTQISLTEDQARRLKRVAADRGVSMATVIREAIELYVPEHDVSREERVRRVLESAGRYRSDVADASERHDDYLAEDARGW
jgi:predicted DNA-binding protein